MKLVDAPRHEAEVCLDGGLDAISVGRVQLFVEPHGHETPSPNETTLGRLQRAPTIQRHSDGARAALVRHIDALNPAYFVLELSKQEANLVHISHRKYRNQPAKLRVTESHRFP